MRFRPAMLFALALIFASIGAGWWYQNQGSAAGGIGSKALDAQLASAGISDKERAAIEALVRTTILEHPEMLPEAMEKLEARETAARLAPLRSAVETPFPGSVLGNQAGKLTLVEFTDFACGYCRSSVADVDALVSANPDLRVVVRHLPIISPESGPAARMGLAAAAQGKYAAFHKAMFAGDRPSPSSIAAAARSAGLDPAAADVFDREPGAQLEIDRNLGFARQLGVGGTPAWAIGGAVLTGAVGREKLQQAIDAARKG